MRALTGALTLTGLIVAISAVVAARPAAKPKSPIYGVTLPRGYRDWKLVSVAHEAGKNDDIRAILANPVALEAFRQGTRPFPDGAIIARLAWKYQSSAKNDAVFPAPQSFVAGPPTNVQISVKDSRRYVGSGGWGYGQFDAGRPNMDRTLIQSCFSCHTKLSRQADFVFTDYAP